MKIQGSEKADWSFPLPDEGDHIVQFIDVEIFHSDKTDKDLLRFNAQIVEGDCDGMNVSIFVTMFNKFGAKKLGDILVCSGIAEAIEKRFPDDNTDIWGEEVIDAISVLIPEKYVKITVQHGEYNNKPSANVVGISQLKRRLDNEPQTPRPKQTSSSASSGRPPRGRPPGGPAGRKSLNSQSQPQTPNKIATKKEEEEKEWEETEAW